VQHTHSPGETVHYLIHYLVIL